MLLQTLIISIFHLFFQELNLLVLFYFLLVLLRPLNSVVHVPFLLMPFFLVLILLTFAAFFAFSGILTPKAFFDAKSCFWVENQLLCKKCPFGECRKSYTPQPKSTSGRDRALKVAFYTKNVNFAQTLHKIDVS